MSEADLRFEELVEKTFVYAVVTHSHTFLYFWSLLGKSSEPLKSWKRRLSTGLCGLSK